MTPCCDVTAASRGAVSRGSCSHVKARRLSKFPRDLNTIAALKCIDLKPCRSLMQLYHDRGMHILHPIRMYTPAASSTHSLTSKCLGLLSELGLVVSIRTAGFRSRRAELHSLGREYGTLHAVYHGLERKYPVRTEYSTRLWLHVSLVGKSGPGQPADTVHSTVQFSVFPQALAVYFWSCSPPIIPRQQGTRTPAPHAGPRPLRDDLLQGHDG
jgi:hypothetical protein